MAVSQVLGTDKAIRLNNYNTLGLVQNFNWAPNFNAQDVFELGRTTRLDTLMELETSGSFEVASAGNLAGLIARMKVKTNAGTGAFEGFQYATTTVSGVTTGVNNYKFTQDDLANLKFDIVQHEKTEQTLFNRSTYLACCYPMSFSGRVDATGMAMDTVNWAGQYVVGFPSPYHDIVAVPAIPATSTTLTVTGYSATNYTLAYVTVDGIPYTTDNTQPAYASFATSTITLSGATIPTGSVCTAALYKTTSPNTSWASVHTPQTVGNAITSSEVFGIRGFQASVFIAPGATVDGDGMLTPAAASQWLRVQSLDFNIDMRMEALRQIAQNDQGTSIYTRVPTFPLNMSVNATVTETEWADWKAMLSSTTKPFTGSNIYQNTYDFAPTNLKKEFAVVIQYFTKSGTKIQQLEFNDLRVDGMGNRINVGGRGEITWTLRGSKMTLKGYDINTL